MSPAFAKGQFRNRKGGDKTETSERTLGKFDGETKTLEKDWTGLNWEARVSKSPEVSRQAEEDGCWESETDLWLLK